MRFIFNLRKTSADASPLDLVFIPPKSNSKKKYIVISKNKHGIITPHAQYDDPIEAEKHKNLLKKLYKDDLEVEILSDPKQLKQLSDEMINWRGKDRYELRGRQVKDRYGDIG